MKQGRNYRTPKKQITQDEFRELTKANVEKKLKEIEDSHIGKKKIMIPHPTSPRCFIEKWV